jgi:leader peptidase (prepilin peptidase) / N-methyltransferase
MEPGLLQTFAENPALFIGTCGALGLMIGSFLNVVIHRLPIMMDNELRAECAALAAEDAPPEQAPEAGTPAMQSAFDLVAPEGAGAEIVQRTPEPSPEPTHFNLIVPRSACPKCKARISAIQNIPVISWLVLRGRCANCKSSISARYPLVELATGILSAFIAWHFGFGFTTVAALAFTWFLIALTMIDFDTQYLPDALTYPLLWLGLIVSLWHPAWGEGAMPVGPRDSIIGAVAGYLSLWCVYWAFKLLTGKEGMGYGDFKLLAALGAWLGAPYLVAIILMSSIVGALIGILLLVVGKLANKDIPMPFGPYLAGAGLLCLALNPVMVPAIVPIAFPFGAR